MPRGMPVWLSTLEGTVTSYTRYLTLMKKLCFGNLQPKTPGLGATQQPEGPPDPMLPGECQWLGHVGKGRGEGLSTSSLPSPHLYPGTGAGAVAQVHTNSTGTLLRHISLTVLREQGPNLRER